MHDLRAEPGEATFRAAAVPWDDYAAGWLERVPSYKEQQENLTGKDLTTYGFLGYPLLMASDILLYQADFVPVGQDQQAHVEITREIARRFNQFYKLDGQEVLPEPKVLLTPSPKLPGTDGRKMSKSYGNTIELTDPEPIVRQKLKTMVTDPARVRRTDPGDPDKCPVGDLHKVFSTGETLAKVYDGCRSAGIGCIECKGWAADALVQILQAYSRAPCRPYGGAGGGDFEGWDKPRPRSRRADHGRGTRGDADEFCRVREEARSWSSGRFEMALPQGLKPTWIC